METKIFNLYLIFNFMSTKSKKPSIPAEEKGKGIKALLGTVPAELHQDHIAEMVKYLVPHMYMPGSLILVLNPGGMNFINAIYKQLPELISVDVVEENEKINTSLALNEHDRVPGYACKGSSLSEEIVDAGEIYVGMYDAFIGILTNKDDLRNAYDCLAENGRAILLIPHDFVLLDEEIGELLMGMEATRHEIKTPSHMLYVIDNLNAKDDSRVYKIVANQPEIRKCRQCGCTEEMACYSEGHGNCWWVEANLCSHCANEWPSKPADLAFKERYEAENGGNKLKSFGAPENTVITEGAKSFVENMRKHMYGKVAEPGAQDDKGEVLRDAQDDKREVLREAQDDKREHNQIVYIPVGDIVPDPNQPRRFFEKNELLDLSLNIAAHGIYQPIQVRPVAGELHKYMIVFGERRYRATLLARENGTAIDTMPCMVKEMTDDEALDAQITENLQRHDPHPIEEAVAFERKMKNSTVGELAAWYGKSTKFIAQRLSLNGLINELKEVFFEGKMAMKDALLLAKVNEETQRLILDNMMRGKTNWRNDEFFRFNDVSGLVNKALCNLDSAKFKTEDPLLLPEAGACGNCQYNSKNTLALFTEEGARMCSNAACYKIKTQRAYEQVLNNLAVKEDILFVKGDIFRDDEKEKVKIAESLKVVLGNRDYEIVQQEKKPVWNDFLEKEKEEWPEGATEKDMAEEIEELKVRFENEVKEWEAEQAELNEDRQKGIVKRAFVVADYYSNDGKMVEVRLNEAGLNKIMPAQNGDKKDSNEIAGILEREKRAKELDGEKIYKKVRDYLKGDDNKAKVHIEHSGLMHVQELRSLCVALWDAIGDDQLAKDLFKKDYWEVGKNNWLAKTLISMNIDEIRIVMNRLEREFILSKLLPNDGSHYNDMLRYMGVELVRYYAPNTVKEIENEQDEVAKKREARVNERIEALR